MVDIVSASDPGTVDHVVEVLTGGGVIVLPTDTVYGLAALPGRAAATDRIFELKGRAATVPMAVLCASPESALGLATAISPSARRLADAHWPGPLTLVFRREAGLDFHIGEPADTVGVRCPDLDLVRAVATRTGPIAATSANRHGEPTPATAAEAASGLTGPVDLVVDGGPLPGAASSVIDATGAALVVLRAGPITLPEDSADR